MNYFCLPNQPELLSPAAPGNAYLYGGYDSSEFGPQNSDDTPCAVYRTNDNSVVMRAAAVVGQGSTSVLCELKAMATRLVQNTFVHICRRQC